MAANRMGEQTKERILAAAQQEFLEKGFQQSKVEDIAKRAGLTKVMLYYHFNTKQNILNEIIKHVLEELRQEFTASLSHRDLSGAEGFHEHVRAMMAFFRQRRGVLRLLVAEYAGGSGGADRSLDVFHGILKMVMELAAPAQEANGPDLLPVFFFNAMPMVLYACMEEEFCMGFAMEEEEARSLFAKAFSRTFLANTASQG